VLAAAGDPRVAPVLERVTLTRLAFLERLYADLGSEPAAARRQARLAYALYVGTIDLRRAAPGVAEADVAPMVEALVRAAGRA